MTREMVKEKIIDYETKVNGFDKLCGTGVLVRNLRITKYRAIADIVLITDTETGTRERYNKCEYPLDRLLK